MAYWLDDSWEGGPMIRRAGTAAFGLYTLCGLWIARHLTDGFIPADVAAEKGSKEWAAKLVDAGLWAIVKGGFRDVFYLELNPTAEEVRERQRKARVRQQRHRASKGTRKDDVVTRDTTRDIRVTDATRHADVTLPPTQPNPTTTTGTYTGSGASRAREAPPSDHQPQSLTEQLLAEYVQSCNRPPPSKVRARLAEEIHSLLGDEFTPDEIRTGIDAWRRKDLGAGALPSVMNGLFNRPHESPITALDRHRGAGDQRRSTTDDRVQGWLELGQRLAAEGVT